MPLHLIKLCVGCGSPEQLKLGHAEELADLEARGRPRELVHTTRQFPRRKDDILPGGSLYWVMKGVILVRQPLVDLRAVTGADGIERCEIVYDEAIIHVRPTPRRAFQGWRYLNPADAPPDVGGRGSDFSRIPAAMRVKLLELGLL